MAQNYSKRLYPNLGDEKHRKRNFLLLIILVLILGIGIYALTHRTSPAPVAKKVPVSNTKAIAAEKAVKANLEKQLTAIIAQYPNVDVSVSVIDLKTDQPVNIGDPAAFVGASTTKVITAACFLKQVEQGKQTLSESMGAFTARWQLEQMINQSDNDAWALLDDALGGQVINDYAHSIGAASFDWSTNEITAADEALVLEKLYQGKLLDKTDTNLLLSWMQKTNDEDLIPAGLPTNVTVYHKYGELDSDVVNGQSENVLHDAAIIKDGSHTFVLSIFTNEIDYPDYQNRENLFHQITKAVLDIEI